MKLKTFHCLETLGNGDSVREGNAPEEHSSQARQFRNLRTYRKNKLDWNLYACLTQLYGGIDTYNLLHKEQLYVSALFTGHL